MTFSAPEERRPRPGRSPSIGYLDFYAQVAGAQLADWAPPTPSRVLDLSDDGLQWARQLASAGHAVLHVDRPGSLPNAGATVPGITTVKADCNGLDWLADGCVDAVLAEGQSLSRCLATEQTCRELFRVLRPGGRLLLVVDSLVTGLARLADQGRWAELADVPFADCVLVPQEDGGISRCFRPEELAALLVDSGMQVQWVRSRTILTLATVNRALDHGQPAAMAVLLRTELALAAEREGEASGLHLVASARRPA